MQSLLYSKKWNSTAMAHQATIPATTPPWDTKVFSEMAEGITPVLEM